MIISASRRTDIPAFYARWLINRLRTGYCRVPNPFNPAQAAEISLRPEDVDVIVFWTRSPRPLFAHLDELDEKGYRYYFQYTLLDYPPLIEPFTPNAGRSQDMFRRLADRIGPERVIWRYDPILLSDATPADFHAEKFGRIAENLHGYTQRVVISFMDVYPKLRRRLKTLAEQGVRVWLEDGSDGGRTFSREQILAAGQLAEIARQNGLEIVSCAEEIDLRPYGISPGKCIDGELIGRIFGLLVSGEKDPNQRKACGCAVSKDIGVYSTCLFGCQYCYATSSFSRASENYHHHNPESNSLI